MNCNSSIKYLIVTLTMFFSLNGFSQKGKGLNEIKQTFLETISNEQKKVFLNIESSAINLSESYKLSDITVLEETTESTDIESLKKAQSSKELDEKRKEIKEQALLFYNGLSEVQKEKFCNYQIALGTSCPK